MTVSSFIKENRVLVAGLTLPLLLIGILAIAKSIPESMVPPPLHKVMYSSMGWSAKGQISIKLDTDGKLSAVFNPTANYTPNVNDKDPVTLVFLFDPKTNTTDQTSITLDKDGKPAAFEKFSNLTLTSQVFSDDGYQFTPYNYQNSSLITDIFAYRSRATGPALINKSHSFPVPQPQSYYGTLEFVGWVKDEAAK